MRRVVCMVMLWGISAAHSATDEEVVKQAEAYFRSERYREAFETIKPLADKGLPEAQGKLGALYAWGLGTARDQQTAVELIRSAAEKNYSRAQHVLCILQLSGDGVPKDPRAALDWCTRAAKNGNRLAMTDTGLFYIRGEHVPRSPERAYTYWEQAAALGDVRANMNIAELLERGELGGARDPMGAVARRMSASLAADSFCPNMEWPCPDSAWLEKCSVTPLIAMIEQGMDVNTRAQSGHTALHCAATKGNAKLAKLLLERRARVDAANPNGVTPLHLAAQSGSYEVVETLVSAGADVNAVTHRNASPLHAAALGRNTKVVALLLSKGSNVNARGEGGATPLDVANRTFRSGTGVLVPPDRGTIEQLKASGGKCEVAQR